jgi:urease accessory protein
MPRVIRILAGDEPRRVLLDTLILNADQRRMQRGFVFGGKGTCVEFDFADPVMLRTDDALLLDDGTVVEVVAQAEPLIEVRADLAVLVRLAWMLGDRHVPVEIFPNRLRLRHDPQLEPLLRSAGGKVVAIEAPFNPEGGAYATAAGSDGHHHHDHDGHAHSHGHDHHGHGHGHDDHAHGHDDHAHTHHHNHAHKPG